ncbi:MAG: hypothetical protein WD426_09210 [Anditalea sp.]
MDRIVLEVNSRLAQAWRKSTPKVRAKYERKITEMLREMKETEFDNLLNKAGKIAEKNGLTEDKLDQLLNEED